MMNVEEFEKMKEMYHVLNDGILEVDSGWTIHYANPKALNLLNISSSFSGMDLRSHLEENFEIKPEIAQIDLKQKNIPAFKVIRNESDKFRPLFLSLHCFLADSVNNHSNRILLIIKDETGDYLEGGIQADFLTLISHKLRTPIVALNYAMNLVQRRKELNFSENETEDFLQQSYVKSIEIAEMIEKIIRFCSVIKDKFYSRNDSCDLIELLNEVIGRYERKYKRFRPPYQLHVHPPEKKIHIAMSSEYAALIFENIIDNAVKFNDKEDPKVTVSFRNEDRILWVDVTDNGCGIPSEMHDKIFEKFFQIEKFFTGTVEGVGLGLTVVKHILYVYNQSISIESKMGVGTTVHFTLPLKMN
ncbi:MAG: PAS domain-containing sensor histidine kinase [Candidatus Aureabacteria bacterium]|nr:PAS domain-containing sensor histidine kinase [Candidatus Auribacterota bacterium]